MTRSPLLLAALLLTPTVVAAQEKRPNIVVIIADDMGHGDLGFHGNPKIKTPHLDKLAKQSVRMTSFHVAPVCSPTRASLLTGRYNYRTGVVDTFVGRSMMHPDEVTLAEVLRAAGFKTGIFGKWHLGDCFPLRPMEQGFEESLVHRGGGIGQPSDPPGGSSYFDPILQHNGKQVQKKGYCTDVFTEAAIDFIGKNRAGPFFVWLAYNAPHGPHEVPASYEAPYAKVNLEHDQFPKVGYPLPGKANQQNLAKVYGMVTNIDDNVGKLLAKLAEWGIDDNTIVIFLTDNGPAFPRYNSGMRGIKGTVFEGGTRVPFFVRWPARLKGDRDIDRIAAHIDLMPTLMDACGIEPPTPLAPAKGKGPLIAEELQLDGKSLLPLWLGQKVDWPDRLLFFQWHRGDVPQIYRACAVRAQKYRLVQPEGVQEKKGVVFEPLGFEGKFLLFDIENDPYETKDVAAEHPEVVVQMKQAYTRWFKEMALARAFQPPRIFLGSKEENPVVLTKQDWRGPKAGWGPKDLGGWEVKVVSDAKYDVTIHLPPGVQGGTAHLKIRDKLLGKKIDPQAKHVTFLDVRLPEGNARLEAWIAQGTDTRGPQFVEVRKKE